MTTLLQELHYYIAYLAIMISEANEQHASIYYLSDIANY